MRQGALVQARLHWLALAEICIEIENAPDLRVLTRRWIEFLDTAFKIQEKLEKRAPDRNLKKDVKWRDAIIAERHEDELLRYLRSARNVSNHGLGDLTRVAHKWITLPNVLEEYNSILGRKPSFARFVQNHKDTLAFHIGMSLLPLQIEEHGQTTIINPPVEHLGVPIIIEPFGVTPRCLARIVATYLAKKLLEAGSL